MMLSSTLIRWNSAAFWKAVADAEPGLALD
jgi:hypothetical protein